MGEPHYPGDPTGARLSLRASLGWIQGTPKAPTPPGLTQVTEAAVEPRITQTGPMHTMTAATVCTATLAATLGTEEAMGTAWTVGGMLQVAEPGKSPTPDTNAGAEVGAWGQGGKEPPPTQQRPIPHGP